MVSMTVQQCRDAVRGLTLLAKVPFPIAFGVRIAKLRFAAQSQVDPVDEAQRAALLARAKMGDDGKPVVGRHESGQLMFTLTPAQQYDAELESDEANRAVVSLDVEPLTLADIPTRVAGDEVVIMPDVFVLLGPLFLD